jgi:hypothetical protein
MSEPGEMTKGERDELAKVVRMRAKVARDDVDALKAERLADFEQQLATQYEARDERWRDLVTMAQQACAEAQAELDRRCEAAGIPQRFRPSLSVGWRERGENIDSKRRTELRRVAQTRLEADAHQAKVEITRREAVLRGELAARGLSSREAREWLERLPTVEALLPALRLAEIEAESSGARLATRDRLIEGERYRGPWYVPDDERGDLDEIDRDELGDLG